MKPTLPQIQAVLAQRADLTRVEPSDEWGGAIAATFDGARSPGPLTFLVKPASGRGVLSLVVPNLWRVPLEDEAWSLRAALAQAAGALQCKPILAPDGHVHLGLGVAVAAGIGLESLVERALELVRRDLETFRGTVIALAQAARGASRMRG